MPPESTMWVTGTQITWIIICFLLKLLAQRQRMCICKVVNLNNVVFLVFQSLYMLFSLQNIAASHLKKCSLMCNTDLCVIPLMCTTCFTFSLVLSCSKTKYYLKGRAMEKKGMHSFHWEFIPHLPEIAQHAPGPFQSSTWVAGAQTFRPSCIAFSGKELNQKQSSWDLNRCSVMGCQLCKQWLNPLYIAVLMSSYLL